MSSITSPTQGPSQAPATKPYTRSAQFITAAQAVALTLRNEPYVIVEDVAFVLLGCTRDITNLDYLEVFVPDPYEPHTKALLAQQTCSFGTDKDGDVFFKSNPPVEIIVSHMPLLPEDYPPFVETTAIKVVRPDFTLLARLCLVKQRPDKEEDPREAADIHFCLDWCARNNVRQPVGPSIACREVVEPLIAKYKGVDLWLRAGYNFETCKLPFALVCAFEQC